MKKRILLVALMAALLVCLFAVTAYGADPSVSDEFGETSFITDNNAINQKSDYGYAEGDTARVVVKVPGTQTYLTYPAYYIFDFRDDGKDNNGWQPVLNMTYLQNATGLDYDEASVIRIEMPNYFTAISTNYSKLQTCTSLKSIHFQSNMWLIHQKSLMDLKNLESVTFEDNPDSVKGLSIGVYVFSGCSSLKEVDLPVQLASLGERTFAYCTSLTAIELPGTRLQSIPTACFMGSNALQTVTISENNNITTIGHKAFNGCSALTGAYVFEKVTQIDSWAFESCATNETTYLSLSFPSLVTLGGDSGDPHPFSNSGVAEIYIGDDLAKTGYQTFTNCKRLWRVEIAGVAQGFEFKSYIFDGCSALKAFSIPEGITALPARMFRNCTSLTAVYLPSTLTAINSGDNDSATFKNCTSMYLVNEPFTYKTISEIPQEPEVYFFPNSLAKVDGETFDGSRVNNIVVFGTNAKIFPDAFMFEGTTSENGKPIVVFLADTTNVQASSWNTSGIYFCNQNDIDATTAGLSGKTAVFCNAQGNTTHLANPLLTVSSDPDCITNIFETETCFCGKEMGATEVKNTALGHNHDLANGAILIGIIYEDYTADGYKVVKCSRCDKNDNTQVASKIILDETGFSAKINGNGITFGYNVDNVALAELKSVYAGTQIGFVTAVKSYLGTNNPLDENANEVALEKGKVLKADVTNEIIENNITRIDFKLVGSIWDSKVDLDGNAENGAEVAVKDISFVMSAYIYANDTVSYINANNGAPQEVIYSTLTE